MLQMLQNLLSNPICWLVGGVAIWCVLQLLERQLIAYRYNIAFMSAAVGAAVVYWVRALVQEHPELNDGSQEHKRRFEGALRHRLAAAYASNRCFPDIGVFYYAPHHYGACPILWGSLFAAGLGHPSNRDIAHSHFRGDGRMTITLEKVTLGTGLTTRPAVTIWPPQKATAPADA